MDFAESLLGEVFPKKPASESPLVATVCRPCNTWNSLQGTRSAIVLGGDVLSGVFLTRHRGVQGSLN